MIVSINVQYMLFLFQKFVKYVKNLLSICACGDYCCLTTKGDEATGQVGPDPPTGDQLGVHVKKLDLCMKITFRCPNAYDCVQCNIFMTINQCLC